MQLKVYQSSFYQDILHYVQTDALLTYTGVPKDNVAISTTTRTYHAIVVYEKNQLVCFFALDDGPEKERYTGEESALVLRSFSTDARYLRKGYGMKTLSLLPDFVRAQFPSSKEIVLGVNQKNLPAQALYEQAGFLDNGREIIGPKGPQRVMVYEL